MSSQNSGSYTLSVLIHAGVAGLFFLGGWVVQKSEKEPVKVFDVVAGAGDNWQATEAPALGVETGREDLKMPQVSVPMPKIDDPSPPEPDPVAPVPAPEPEPPIKPAPLPKPKEAAKPAPKPDPLDAKKTTFAEDFDRLQKKRFNRKIEAHRKQVKATEEKERKEAAKRMTEEEFRKSQGKKGGGSTTPAPKVDAKGIAGGVVGGSTKNMKGGAGGKALSAEEASLMDRYFAFLKQRLKAAHIPPPGAGDQLETTIEFFCSADGSLSRVRVVDSSGNPEFDQSVLEAFKRVKSIGARPDGRSEMLELVFKARED